MFLDISDEIGNLVFLLHQFEEGFVCVNTFSHDIIAFFQSAVDSGDESVFHLSVLFEFVFFLETSQHFFVANFGTHVFFNAFCDAFFLVFKALNA